MPKRPCTRPAQFNHDLAVIDLGLPGMGGLDLIRQLRTQAKTFPILILTARGNWQDKVEGLAAGADDYVVKPFQFEELEARLNALLRRSSGFHPVHHRRRTAAAGPQSQAGVPRRTAAGADRLRVSDSRIPDASPPASGGQGSLDGTALPGRRRARSERDRSAGRPPAAQARRPGRVQADRYRAWPGLPVQ